MHAAGKPPRKPAGRRGQRKRAQRPPRDGQYVWPCRQRPHAPARPPPAGGPLAASGSRARGRGSSTRLSWGQGESGAQTGARRERPAPLLEGQAPRGPGSRPHTHLIPPRERPLAPWRPGPRGRRRAGAAGPSSLGLQKQDPRAGLGSRQMGLSGQHAAGAAGGLASPSVPGRQPPRRARAVGPGCSAPQTGPPHRHSPGSARPPSGFSRGLRCTRVGN